jgi:cytoskeletal protein RodZ
VQSKTGFASSIKNKKEGAVRVLSFMRDKHLQASPSQGGLFMRVCGRFFAVALVLIVIGFLLGISFPAVAAEKDQATDKPIIIFKPLKSPVKSTPVEPAAVKSTEAKPSTAKPAEVKPVPVEPAAVKSTPVKRSVAKRSPAKTVPVEPAAVKSTEAKPSAAKPAEVKPVPVEPATAAVPAPVKRAAVNCKYTTKIDKSSQVVYMPIGGECEQLLKDFTLQSKSCCVCAKDTDSIMVCKGACCPVMLDKVDIRR